MRLKEAKLKVLKRKNKNMDYILSKRNMIVQSILFLQLNTVVVEKWYDAISVAYKSLLQFKINFSEPPRRINKS